MSRIAQYKISLLIVIVIAMLFGTTGSCRLQAQTTVDSTQRLSSLCKVWGFLKYYHPAVASGKYDWDSMLVHYYVPKALQADTKEKLSTFYMETINQLGSLSKYPEPPPAEPNASENKYLQWGDDSTCFSPELIALLHDVQKHRYTKEGYYVKPVKYKNNASFENEKVYAGKDHSTGAMRLLSLFRYWNAVEYFSPYKYLTDRNWDTVPAYLATDFYNAIDTVQYQMLLQELVALLNDSHAYLLTPIVSQLSDYIPPFNVKTIDGVVVVNRIYNDSLAKLDDIEVGDIIERADGEDIVITAARIHRYASGSNQATVQRYIDSRLLNGSTPTVRLAIKRNGKEQERIYNRYAYDSPLLRVKKGKGDVYKTLDGNIGYINLGLLKDKDVEKVMDELAGTNAIIMDVRRNANGTMYALCERIAGGKKAFVAVTHPDYDMPGNFIKSDLYYCGDNKKDVYSGKIVVLVNEVTQSHGEFTCMAFKTRNNVTVVGSPTAGADGNVSYFTFPGGYETHITGLGVYYPDGSPTQRVGIVPDIEVKPTVTGIQQQRDEVLEKAIEVAKSPGKK